MTAKATMGAVSMTGVGCSLLRLLIPLPLSIIYLAAWHRPLRPRCVLRCRGIARTRLVAPPCEGQPDLRRLRRLRRLRNVAAHERATLWSKQIAARDLSYMVQDNKRMIRYDVVHETKNNQMSFFRYVVSS